MTNDSRTTWRGRVLSKYYYGRAGWSDGTTRFHNLIARYAADGSEILELGAGPANRTTEFLAGRGAVTGVDVDPDVLANHFCSRAIVYDGIRLSLPSNSFDVVVSNYVCEHIEHPPAVCGEIHRVLRPGGTFIFRTPNLWHYVSIISSLTPHWLHRLVANRARGLSDYHEPYPTFHRMNTRRSCRRILRGQGFQIVHCTCIEPEPSYAMASPLMFYPAMAWERLINSTSALEDLRANILCVARKDG